MYSFENLPPVPLTIEGASLLHQMFRVRWPAWRALPAEERNQMACEAVRILREMETDRTAVFSLLGHKGDLMLVHFRPGFDELNQIELALTRLRIWDYLEL